MHHEPYITRVPDRAIDHGRHGEPQPIPDSERPQELQQRPLTFSFWERATIFIDETVAKVSLRWTLLRVTAELAAATITLKKGLDMNNDQKATILGWTKTVLVIIGTILFADKISDVTGLATILVGAIGAVWAGVEAVQGAITNKPEKK